MENELKNKKTKQILPNFLKKWWPKLPMWRKWLTIGFGVFLALFYAQYFGISYWYAHKHAKEPLQIGATFIPDYAREFELDPKETLGAMINDLGIRRFRLVSYWNNIEKVQGTYDFT